MLAERPSPALPRTLSRLRARIVKRDLAPRPQAGEGLGWGALFLQNLTVTRLVIRVLQLKTCFAQALIA